MTGPGTGAAAGPGGRAADLGYDLAYGPFVADERELRLLGNVAGRRVLVLGCGDGGPAVALAAVGARVIAVDPSAEAVAVTRRAAALRHAAVDVQARDLAELAFVRAESIDVAVSVGALAAVADLLRVFRQVHRVLRVEGTVVMSVPHPILGCLADDARSGPDEVRLVRRYGAPVSASQRSSPAHTTEALVTALTRVGFRVEALLELLARPPAAADGATPTGPADATGWSTLLDRLPATLVLRARKTGL